MGDTIDDRALDLLFRQARTQNGWLPTPVTDDQLRALYDIVRVGPTSANTCPARFVFLRTPAAKARLLPALTPGNVDKTKQAPVTAIIGYDTRFFEWMPKKLFSHRPEMADTYAKNPALSEVVAFRNGTLQGAYFMLAARAVGLDVGGMGFDNARSTPVLPRRPHQSSCQRIDGGRQGDAEHYLDFGRHALDPGPRRPPCCASSGLSFSSPC